MHVCVCPRRLGSFGGGGYATKPPNDVHTLRAVACGTPGAALRPLAMPKIAARMEDCGRYWYFPAPGRGGLGMVPEKTAIIFIEFQNEFATEGGKVRVPSDACGSLSPARRRRR